jgi:hypothetical protein
MKRFLSLTCALFGLGAAPVVPAQPLDYDQLILLDAESLAETGIREAYERILPSLKKYVHQPARIEELIDSGAPAYAVRSPAARYDIYSEKTPQEQSWANATFALFDIVNRQLVNRSHKFYAISAGNELGGMFLTEVQYRAATKSLKNKSDWPYIPDRDAPWYGQPH